jgi:hypothetical protein
MTKAIRFAALFLLGAIMSVSHAEFIRGNIAEDPLRASKPKSKAAHNDLSSPKKTGAESSKSLLKSVTYDQMARTYPSLIKRLESIWGMPAKDSPVLVKRK